MTDCENKWQQESVIAKLMGFDQVLLPHRQPVHEKRRLLSENYIRKAASVGLRHGSLVSNGHICSTRRVQISKSKNNNVLDKVTKGKRSPKPADASASKSLSNANNGGIRSSSNKGEHCVRRHVLRYLQKLEHDIDYTNKSLNSQLEMIVNPCIFSTNISTPKRKSVANGKHGCIACTRSMNRIFQQEQGRSKFREVTKPGYIGDNFSVNEVDNKNDSHDDTYLLLDQSSLIDESGQQNSERLTKKLQEVGVFGRHQIIDEKSSEGDKELKEQTVSYAECVGDEFKDSLKKRTSQHSPDSVLEPFDVQNFSTFEYFDRIGLQLQLQALNMESSEETYSERSIMDVSDDEDFPDVQFSDDLSLEGRKIKRWLGDDQSRSFSYMVDVLNEAGLFYGTESLTDLRYPICPSVFEALEKTYGEQTSWLKSERRLLFDRINSALKFHLSVRRRFCAFLKRGEVEDELWRWLIREENESSKDLCDKDLEKWLGFEEGVDIVCTEMEASLFDDLVMELVSSLD